MAVYRLDICQKDFMLNVEVIWRRMLQTLQQFLSKHHSNVIVFTAKPFVILDVTQRNTFFMPTVSDFTDCVWK